MYIYTDGLETARLRTRFIEAGDKAAWMAFAKDPVATRFIPNDTGISDDEFAGRWIDFSMKRYAEQRYGLQALIHNESGAFIGLCGLLLQEINGRNEIEIGYHLFPKYWGQGYASEAAQAFRDYGFAHRVADSIISIIHPLNFQSKNVAKRNGMQLSEAGVMFRDKEVDVFRINHAAWENIQANK